ncbi:MAG: hypothetical protein ACREX3_14965, partial [Gammaproteobacteria bacterium]
KRLPKKARSTRQVTTSSNRSSTTPSPSTAATKRGVIEGIAPAIAIDQTNPVHTSRSTVGTIMELNDHLKLLFARAAKLYCRGCGKGVRRDTPGHIRVPNL